MKGINGGWSCKFPVEAEAIYGFRFHYRAEGGPSRIIIYVREVRDGRIGKSIVYKPVAMTSEYAPYFA